MRVFCLFAYFVSWRQLCKTRKKNKIFFHKDIKIHVKVKKKGLKNTHQTGNSVPLSPAKCNGTMYFLSVFLKNTDNMLICEFNFF